VREIGSLALVIAVAVLFAAPARANLILNGSFEDSTVHPSTWVTLYAGSTDIANWTITRDNIDLKGGYWIAQDGSQSLDLDGSGAFGAIAQSFATAPGQMYQVAFAMAGNPDGCGVRQMRVSAAGVYADFAFDSCGHTYSDMGWDINSWVFSATSSVTTLEFSSLDSFETGDSGAYGPALDNVVVTIVPEPSAALLLAFGLVALAAGRRRRQV